MPYANNDGIRIHYHVDGEGPPLVLQHGFSDSLRAWYVFGYVEALKNDYQLILVDARGHGKSDKPHEPESYELEILVDDIVAVLDELDIRKAHYYGYSMGGRISYGIARYAPERFHSLINGTGRTTTQSQEIFRTILSKGIGALVALIEDTSGPLVPEWKANLLENDATALIASLVDFPPVDDILPEIVMPCLLYAGDADPSYENVKEAALIIPNSTFFGLPGLDHVQGAVRSELVLPHIKDFLTEVESKSIAT